MQTSILLVAVPAGRGTGFLCIKNMNTSSCSLKVINQRGSIKLVTRTMVTGTKMKCYFKLEEYTHKYKL